jgi:hypothetical protein
MNDDGKIIDRQNAMSAIGETASVPLGVDR